MTRQPIHTRLSWRTGNYPRSSKTQLSILVQHFIPSVRSPKEDVFCLPPAIPHLHKWRPRIRPLSTPTQSPRRVLAVDQWWRRRQGNPARNRPARSPRRSQHRPRFKIHPTRLFRHHTCRIHRGYALGSRSLISKRVLFRRPTPPNLSDPTLPRTPSLRMAKIRRII